MQRQYRTILLFVAAAFLLVVGYRTLSSKKSRKLASVAASPYQKAPSQEFVDKSKSLLAQLPEQTDEAKKAMKAFNNYLEHNVGAQIRFYQTLEFFGNQPGAYPAARYLAVSGLYVTNPEMIYLMQWTQKDLNKNSAGLMATLEEKHDQIYSDPFIHESFLNLAYHLDVPASRKLEFYAESMKQPLEFKTDGSLADKSIGFETALILSKQVNSDGASVASYIKPLLASADKQTADAIKVRVLTYYPDLKDLFN